MSTKYITGVEFRGNKPYVRWSDGSLSLPPIGGGAPDDEDEDEKKKGPKSEKKDDKSDEDDEPKDDKAEVEKWKGLARKHEADAKKNAAAAKRLEELEAAKKTDAEKAADAQKAAEGRATAAEKEAARLRVALRKGLTEAHAKRLVGETEEELEADADDLLSTFGSNEEQADKSVPRKPREELKPGSTNQAEPEAKPSEIAEKVLAKSF